MTIAITGVNGFIGQHLSKALIRKGYAVTGIGKEDKSVIPRVLYHKGDVLNKKFLGKIIYDCDAIVHLAALTSHKDIVDNQLKTQKINLNGTKNILDIFIKSKAKKFIYPSTGKVYGNIRYLPIDENHPTQPQNILGKLKLEVEDLIKSYETQQKKLIIFRAFNVYGHGQDENFLIPTILKQLSDGKREIILGDVKAKRDYVYIDDLVSAFVLAIEKKLPPGVSIYNICTGKESSASQIVNMISKIKGIDIKIKVNPALIRGDEMKEEYGSFEKAKRVLGWEPKVNFKDGLGRLIS